MNSKTLGKCSSEGTFSSFFAYCKGGYFCVPVVGVRVNSGCEVGECSSMCCRQGGSFYNERQSTRASRTGKTGQRWAYSMCHSLAWTVAWSTWWGIETLFPGKLDFIILSSLVQVACRRLLVCCKVWQLSYFIQCNSKYLARPRIFYRGLHWAGGFCNNSAGFWNDFAIVCIAQLTPTFAAISQFIRLPQFCLPSYSLISL